MLIWGAYFHDIGKLAVPLEILNKKDKLTPTEWEIMKFHTTKGAEMIRNHELTLEAAIVSVVDSFDAMTTNRVYREALSIDEAIQEIIRGRGTQFQTEVVDAFLNLCIRTTI